MMIGSIRWNFIVGAVSFLITFALSISNNIWLTTIIRSFYSFVILFLVVFLCRWILGSFAGLNQHTPSQNIEASKETRGIAVDAITPDQDEELHQMLKHSLDPNDSFASDFSPLNPPKLSTKVNSNPEELVQALRQMSED